MHATTRRVLAVAMLVAAGVASGIAQAAIYKCNLNGRITYQNDPCPSGQERKQPTVEELNAARKKSPLPLARSPAPLPPADQAPVPLAKAPPRATFSCDGRTHCTQMTSCSEARFFLANCPTSKMDGDGDGIPCEQQWCH